MLKKYLKFYVFGKTKVLSGAPVINVKYFLLVFLKIWTEIYPLWHTGYHYDIVAHMKEFNKKLNRNVAKQELICHQSIDKCHK